MSIELHINHEKRGHQADGIIFEAGTYCTRSWSILWESVAYQRTQTDMMAVFSVIEMIDTI